jgi:hypothetical protein
MSDLLTAWGYSIADTTALADLLTIQDFNTITANKYTGDSRIEPNIKAASQAVRNYCGWHIYPSSTCKLSTSFYDKRITRNGNMILIQLPATFVTSVTAVRIGGETYNNFVIETNGILRIFGISEYFEPYTTIEVEYIAGLSDALVANLQELVAHRVTHALASSAGIQSETAGGVSITYSAVWTNTARSTALPSDNKEVLAPYRLMGVF